MKLLNIRKKQDLVTSIKQYLEGKKVTLPPNLTLICEVFKIQQAKINKETDEILKGLNYEIIE